MLKRERENGGEQFEEIIDLVNNRSTATGESKVNYARKY